jgi:uncharacterized membrane protein
VATITRATIVHFVVAAVLGAAAGVIHLFRAQVGSLLGNGVPLTVLTIIGWVLLVAAALLLYFGMMRAAAEQDAALDRREQVRRQRRLIHDERRDDYEWHDPYIP